MKTSKCDPLFLRVYLNEFMLKIDNFSSLWGQWGAGRGCGCGLGVLRCGGAGADFGADANFGTDKISY